VPNQLAELHASDVLVWHGSNTNLPKSDSELTNYSGWPAESHLGTLETGEQLRVRELKKGFAVGFRKFVSREDIERSAFQIFMARSREHGHDIADWLAAERELRGWQADCLSSKCSQLSGRLLMQSKGTT
jgi:Protein of unknown function (DUF2934)